jgi:hypothetical protein
MFILSLLKNPCLNDFVERKFGQGVGNGEWGVGSGEWGSGWVTGWMGGWVKGDGLFYSKNSLLRNSNPLLKNFLCLGEGIL